MPPVRVTSEPVVYRTLVVGDVELKAAPVKVCEKPICDTPTPPMVNPDKPLITAVSELALLEPGPRSNPR